MYLQFCVKQLVTGLQIDNVRMIFFQFKQKAIFTTWNTETNNKQFELHE